MTLFSVLITVIVERDLIVKKSEDFCDWLRLHPNGGPWVLAGILMVGEVCFMPSSILTVVSGFAFKKAYDNFEKAMIVGTFFSWIGISLGAIITMFLGRFVFYEQASSL